MCIFHHIVSATDQDKLLRNKIAQALVERIIRAHEEQEKFKVFIIIPLVSSRKGRDAVVVH